MAWTVTYSKWADADLAGLDKPVAEAIFRKIRRAKENPHHYFERMVELPYYRMRVGDYRIIADLQDKMRIIAILHIGHRKKVYSEIKK